MSELKKWLSVQNVLSNLLIELNEMEKDISKQNLKQIENMKGKATEARNEVLKHILLLSIENQHDTKTKRPLSEAIS